jgi:uncharacterized protein YxjI
VEAGDVGEIHVKGNIVDREYTFETEDDRRIAETSKRWSVCETRTASTSTRRPTLHDPRRDGRDP